jgi:hypothetical protein
MGHHESSNKYLLTPLHSPLLLLLLLILLLLLLSLFTLSSLFLFSLLFPPLFLSLSLSLTLYLSATTSQISVPRERKLEATGWSRDSTPTAFAARLYVSMPEIVCESGRGLLTVGWPGLGIRPRILS